MMRAAVLAALMVAGLGIEAVGAAEPSYTRGAKGVRITIQGQRRGGYSYSYADTINTYGNSRTRYGGANAYRDSSIDRQSPGGPFDHGFFFDSGVGSWYGGQAPYMH
jgi:hypothetical protein